MARLVRVEPGLDPGIRRVREGRAFRYLDERGAAVSEAARRRIRALAIPPGWRRVWIASDPLAHIQAVGTDDAGRRQYIYHSRGGLDAIASSSRAASRWRGRSPPREDG